MNNKILENLIQNNSIDNIFFDQSYLLYNNDDFESEIDCGKVTNQGKSGRCWIFAGINFLNTIIDSKNIDEIDFSANYIYFWDKYEKSYSFLNNVAKLKKDDLRKPDVQWLFNAPLQDGGQWDMFKYIVNKYGLVSCDDMRDTYHSLNSRDFIKVLTKKLRCFARNLIRISDNSIANKEKLIKIYMQEIYYLLSLFLGEPPTRLNLKTKNKLYKEITPLEYKNICIGNKLDDYISIISVPDCYYKINDVLSVQYLGYYRNDFQLKLFNVESYRFKKLAIETLNQTAVWFACDVWPCFNQKYDIMDYDAYNYEAIIKDNLSKYDRLIFRDSVLNHAMVFLGYNTKNGEISKWKIKNSWGEDHEKKGYIVMNDNWFNEYVYQIVVNINLLNTDEREKYNSKTLVIPPWDPIGYVA